MRQSKSCDVSFAPFSRLKTKLSRKAKLWVFYSRCTIFVPILSYGLESWIITERVSVQNETFCEKSIRCLFDKVRKTTIREKSKTCQWKIFSIKNYVWKFIVFVVDLSRHIYFLAHTLPLLGNFPAYFFFDIILHKLCKIFLFRLLSSYCTSLSRRAAVQPSKM